MPGTERGTISIDWRWVVAGYCYLVLFHLLPTYLMGGLPMVVALPHPGAVSDGGLDPTVLMMIWLLAGIAIVAFMVGLRSEAYTVFEPAISGVLYAVTLTLAFRELVSSQVRDRQTLAITFWLLIVAILAVSSAWVGEGVQKIKMDKREPQPLG